MGTQSIAGRIAHAGVRRLHPVLAASIWIAASVAASLAGAADAPPLILEHLTTSDGLPEGGVLA
ncbi:MAG: hypothetical protein ACREUG_14325, partial [Steroidobacteraceae bacterium]